MERIEARTSRRARRRQGLRLVFGTVLLGIGGVLLARNLGLELPLSIGRLWPGAVIALGAARLLLGSREEREGGYWILLGGVYAGLSVWRVAGLGWTTAWPVFLIGAGLWTVIEGLMSGAAKHKEVGNEVP